MYGKHTRRQPHTHSLTHTHKNKKTILPVGKQNKMPKCVAHVLSELFALFHFSSLWNPSECNIVLHVNTITRLPAKSQESHVIAMGPTPVPPQHWVLNSRRAAVLKKNIIIISSSSRMQTTQFGLITSRALMHYKRPNHCTVAYRRRGTRRAKSVFISPYYVFEDNFSFA